MRDARRYARRLALALVAAALPGCHTIESLRAPSAGSPYLVRRPLLGEVLPNEARKPLFISGYAGGRVPPRPRRGLPPTVTIPAAESEPPLILP